MLKLGIDLLNLIYPIGSIYMSVNSVNPSTIFGGTWASWGTGRAPVGVDISQTEFNTVEKTGGNKNLHAHTHSMPIYALTPGTGSAPGVAVKGGTGAPDYTVGTSGSAGTGDSGNLQPYITCYMWKRTA